MNDLENTLLSQLKDISGLHDVSIWPLAIGWWILILIIIAAAIAITSRIIKIKKFNASWRFKIQQELDEIAANPDASKTKTNISRINEILKRLSIQIYGRKETSSLSGKKWLFWLANKDPRNFNWMKKGEILIEFPYMPEEKIQANHEQVATLAKAAKAWLRL